MLNPTPLLRPYFARLVRQRRRSADPESARRVQTALLTALLGRAAGTETGRRYGFAAMSAYEHFASTLPVVEYEDIRADTMRMLAGQPDVLWPGVTRRFAQSSGTSGGKSKYIPVTDDGLKLNHYAGGAQAVASYLDLYHDSRLFAGKGFILGGSFANELQNVPPGVKAGDLSANLIDAINPLANLVRVPSKKIALMRDWSQKLPALAQAAVLCNITNISGVPSWFLTVLRKVLEISGADNIHDVWPGLEVFFHGGIAFGPYRSQYEAITRGLRYIENYNASEGFFAVQDTVEPEQGMRLLLEAGVFYEFIPAENAGDPDKGAHAAVPAWQVEPGRTYAPVITSCNGLWRYMPGDTVRIESVEPLRVSIAGRTNAFINAFGEELMVWNADAAIEQVCALTGASVADYTVAPVYTCGGTKGRHQWLIEWATAPECGAAEFAVLLDEALQKVNSDYQAKRSGNIFLDTLQLVELPAGTFDRWLEYTGRRGGQRKVPRLCNNRRVADGILDLIAAKA